MPFRYAAAFIAAGSFQLITDPLRARAALVQIRAHLVPPGVLVLDLFVPPEGEQRIAAPLIEVRSVTLDDGTRIALRSETTMYPDARLARTGSRYVHRRGHELLAEETESLALTWYAPEDIVALARAAGFATVDVGPPARLAPREKRSPFARCCSRCAGQSCSSPDLTPHCRSRGRRIMPMS